MYQWKLIKTTFSDISVFHYEEEFSIFHKFNFTRTTGGKEWLRRFLSEPHHDLKRILGTQKISQVIINHLDEWPTGISNGTIMVIEKFLDYNLDPVPENPGIVSSQFYKWLHSEDYSMVKYSIKHFADFYRGMKILAELFSTIELPQYFNFYIDRIDHVLKEPPLKQLSGTLHGQDFKKEENLYFTYFLRGRYRTDTLELIEIYSRLDAWYSMAFAIKRFNLSFPEFIEREEPLS